MSGDELFGFGQMVLDRLDRVIDLLESAPTSAPASALAPIRAQVQTSNHKSVVRNNTSKARGISDTAFRVKGAKLLAFLLADTHPEIGKLTSSILREIDINTTMLRTLLLRLRSEGAISISSAPRGKAPYVRIVDVEKAKRRVDQLKEELRVEAEALLR